MKKKIKIIIACVTTAIVLFTAFSLALPQIIRSVCHTFPEYVYDKNDNFEEIMPSYELIKDTILEHNGESTESKLYYFTSDNNNIYCTDDENKTPLLPEDTRLILSNENISTPWFIVYNYGCVSFVCEELTCCEIVYTENILKYRKDSGMKHFYNKIADNWYSIFD